MTSPNPSPSPPDFTVPDAIGEVYLARAWKVEDWSLRSLHCPVVWGEGDALEARCDPAGRALFRLAERAVDEGLHASPGEGCGCGIYGVFDPGRLRFELGFGMAATVWGVVAVWGKLIVGDKGVRGQYARPVALYHQPPPGDDAWVNWDPPRVEAPVIQRVADRYGIDLIDRWTGLTRPGDL